MKAKDFAEVLSAYIDFLGLIDSLAAPSARTSLTALRDIFANAQTATVAALIKQLSMVQANGGAARGSANLGEIAKLLSPLRRLDAPAAKPAVLKDLDIVTAFLAARSTADLASLTGKPISASVIRRAAQVPDLVRDDLVEQYRQQLDANLSSPDGFARVFGGLESTDTLLKAELIALAKRFSGVSARSKGDALKKIWNRHQRLMASQAKARATGGRSAA